MTTEGGAGDGRTPRWPSVAASARTVPGTVGPEPTGTGPEPAGASADETALAPRPTSRRSDGGPALWVVLAGVVVATALAVVVSATVGLTTLAAVLAGAGAWRALAPGPGPVGIAVRSKVVDIVLYEGFAAVLAFLAITTPNI